jgi:ABC-type amino acid transport substrate-binding protein
MEKIEFQRSKELKQLFKEHYELWRKKNSGGLEELSRRCGVSASYLGHVGRYGRVPGKPVLILLAFNFELENPQILFDAAGLNEEWPFDNRLRLLRADDANAGFLSLKLDMQGFTGAIREIVRQEFKPRTITDLSRGRPIRVGFNVNQSWLFKDEGEGKLPSGLYPEIFNMLGIALRNKLEIEVVHHGDYIGSMNNDELDIYGPIFTLPERLGGALYTIPFCWVGISALWRKRKGAKLEELPAPKSIEDLKDTRYEIAVLKGAVSHHFANTRLQRPDSSLILCEGGEEALERLVLTGIKRPAHIVLSDSATALYNSDQAGRDYEILFASKSSILGAYENTIAVRPDWPELVNVLNDTLRFLGRQGTLNELVKKWLPAPVRDVVELAG